MRECCPFHGDDDVSGQRQDDGGWSFTCTRAGHPGDGPWRWLVVPAPPGSSLTGLADELDLGRVLPKVVAGLGDGWFEYGLVERAYASADPDGWRRIVDRWSHTALPTDSDKRYTASAYLAGVLGRLSGQGVVAYHSGRGTGRWSYNSDISWWARSAEFPWEQRTAWIDVVGDTTREAQKADEECRRYVPAKTGS